MIKTLKEWISGKKPGPYIIDINPTDYCNLNCLSCWQRNPNFKDKLDSKWYELPDKRLIELIDEGYKLGVKWWEITGGGEPLMRPLTLKLMQKIKNLGMHGSMTTNGTLFNKGIIKELIEIKWDKITFSIDGPNSKVQDLLRGKKGSFEKALKTLEYIKRLKKESKTKKPLIAFNTVISKENYKKLPEIIELAKKVNCEFVNFESMTVHSILGKNLKLNKKEIKKFQKIIKETQKKADKLRIKTNILSFYAEEFIEKSNSMAEVILKEANEHNFHSISCYEPWYHLVIKVDGTAGPCCIYNDKRMNIRNKSLEEIWHGRRFNRIRKRIIKKRLPKYCSICNAGQVLTNRRLREELKRI